MGGWRDLTEADVKRHNARVSGQLDAVTKASKYHAQPVIVDGYRFASKKEARRYQELRAMRNAGLITNLELQPCFELWALPLREAGLNVGWEGVSVGFYVADFKYVLNGQTIIEDVKSSATATPLYKLKKKIAEACHNITIIEV